MPLTAIWIRYLWLLESKPAACFGFTLRFCARLTRMNSKVVSESPRSFPSWMSFKLVTDWLTNWADDYAFNLRRFGGLGLKFCGSFDFFWPGDSGSSMPPRFCADCNPLCRLIAASDSFPSIDMFVESFYRAPEWSLSREPPCPGKLISELIPSPPNRL